MAWIAILVLTVAAGTLLAEGLMGRRNVSLGLLFGPGIASILYFLGLSVGLGAQPWLVTAATLAIAIGAWWKRSARQSPPQRDWLMLGALVIAAGFVLLDIQTAHEANPNGEWDASGIWNLRARFLAGGVDTWPRAITAEPGSYLAEISHPAYPLFLSSFVGTMWSAAGDYPPAAPAVVSALVALAILALLVTSLPSYGPLAALAVVSSTYFASQASAQYADLLLGLSFLAALWLLEQARSPRTLIACGLAIGLAPWIKNEGQPFALAALAVAAWRFRAGIVWVALGAAPGILATAALKLMSNGRESMFPSAAAEVLSKATDPSRWVQVLSGFGGAIVDAGPWWAHPVLFAAVVAFVAGFRPREEVRARLWLGIPLAAALAAEIGIYLITTSDLSWHISTSVSRLVLQLLPASLWLLFSFLKPPAEPLAEPPSESKRAKRKKQPALS